MHELLQSLHRLVIAQRRTRVAVEDESIARAERTFLKNKPCHQFIEECCFMG